MKIAATGLFVFVSLVFVVSRLVDERWGAADYVGAFAEAAMVGALADWFAVTALFRHPLGLRIPHTAIIPHRKDQIGESLGQFVETNFLTRELLEERLERAHVGARLGEWLADPDNAERATAAIADAVRGVVDVLDDEAISGTVGAMVERRLRETSVAPLVGKVIDIGVDRGHHRRLLDSVLSGLSGFLEENRETFRSRLQQESPWWVPEQIDDRIFAKIFQGVQNFLTDVRADPEHPVRDSIDRRVEAFATRLRDDPELIAKGEEVKDEVLDHPAVRAWIASLWGELKTTLLSAAGDRNSELRQRVAAGLTELGQRLRDDPSLQHKVDTWVGSAAGYLVDNYRGEVSKMISSTVERWDADTTSRRMELQVGRDLQFIRINGTVVGGLAGLLIFVVSRYLL
jgi:uncharacterized membrane-anchored protein YjiN (DUF445 family)